jgi:hypothetical protein
LEFHLLSERDLQFMSIAESADNLILVKRFWNS